MNCFVRSKRCWELFVDSLTTPVFALPNWGSIVDCIVGFIRNVLLLRRFVILRLDGTTGLVWCKKRLDALVQFLDEYLAGVDLMGHG